jgi:hypothetical protein
MIGTRFGGSVVALAELVAAAETRATEIYIGTLRRLPLGISPHRVKASLFVV